MHHRSYLLACRYENTGRYGYYSGVCTRVCIGIRLKSLHQCFLCCGQCTIRWAILYANRSCFLSMLIFDPCSFIADSFWCQRSLLIIFAPKILMYSYRQIFWKCYFFFQGAFTFRGNMIDMPLLLQAKNIVQLAEAVKVTWATEADHWMQNKLKFESYWHMLT